MSDDPSPEKILGIASLAIGALAGIGKAVASVVKWFTARFDARIAEAKRIAKLEHDLEEAKRAERKNSEAMRALLLEVERLNGAPPSIPPPSFDDPEETTKVRRQNDARIRHRTAQTVSGPYRERQSSIHDPELQRYLSADSTPPETPDSIARTWPPRDRKR